MQVPLQSSAFTDQSSIFSSQPAASQPSPSGNPPRRRLQHGLYAKDAVVLGESEADFERFRATLFEDLAPAGAEECIVAEQMAVAQWQLQRVWRMRTGTFRVLQRGNPETRNDAPDEQLACWFLQDCTGARGLERLSAHEVRLTILFHKGARRLEALREKRRREAQRAAQQAAASASHDGTSGGIAESHIAGRTHVASPAPEPAAAENLATPNPAPSPATPSSGGAFRDFAESQSGRTFEPIAAPALPSTVAHVGSG